MHKVRFLPMASYERSFRLTESKTYNYTNVKHIDWLAELEKFKIKFTDCNKQTYIVYTKSIVNACGVWADSVNQKFNIHTKASHHLSKGVYLLLHNTENLKDAFVVAMQKENDTLCWVPWDKTIMQGPTETTINTIDELAVTKEDVKFLLDELNSKLVKKIGFQDIKVITPTQ